VRSRDSHVGAGGHKTLNTEIPLWDSNPSELHGKGQLAPNVLIYSLKEVPDGQLANEFLVPRMYGKSSAVQL